MCLPLAAEGEFVLVRQHLERALQLSSMLTRWGANAHEHDLYILLADTAAQQRSHAALQLYLPRAEELASEYGHSLYQAIAHRARGVAHRLAGEHTHSEARLNQAQESFRALGTRWQLGRTHSELAELAQDRMDFAGAREHFSRALLAYDALGARPDAERTRASLESLELEKASGN